jgi:DNA-directed RNA polymerase subunit M/transcription elongation factor TFIIS
MSSLHKIDNSELFRVNVQKRLETLFSNVNAKLNNVNTGAQKYEKQCINLEKGIFNYSLKEANNRKVVKKWDNPYFVQIYVDRLRTIMHNIQKNPSLLADINEKDFKIHNIAFMTHQEMQPERWSEMLDAKAKRDKNKFEVNIEAATDTFTCRKCKSNRCSYAAVQTRSSDEPMTIFVTCLDCGQRWKC